MTPILLTPPAAEPVSRAEAKAWLRLDTADEDTLVTALVLAARMVVEAAARRVLVTQSWRLVYDRWPRPVAPALDDVTASPPVLPLPIAPMQSVSAIRVYDAAGAAQTVAPSAYQAVGGPDETRLLFAQAPPAPGRAIAGVEIDVVAGYGGPTDAPQPLRQAILMLAAHWHENRGDAEAASPDHLPPAIAALVQPFRRVRLA